MPLFEVANKTVNNEGTYTKKISIPQYTPANKMPHISEMCNYDKYSKLLAEINSSTVTDDEKKFLKLAASRHIVFNYSKIADYYAHTSPEMQSLMEKSALVILDIDDAIANGYVKLSKDIERIMAESGKGVSK